MVITFTPGTQTLKNSGGGGWTVVVIWQDAFNEVVKSGVYLTTTPFKLDIDKITEKLSFLAEFFWRVTEKFRLKK